MTQFLYPIIAVEPDFTDLIKDHSEYKSRYNHQLLFVVDSAGNYYSPEGDLCVNRWKELCDAAKKYVSAQGYCCTAKLQFDDENQIFALLKELDL
ncbi:hypothetical protein AAEU32_07935 [Pseudoalteromonas sp. SSDWG2]|uniref:hypothetical protein n=1 Tax=Pseudoalteromonas sp. SSDWG2 TaxID=3139391 RepID=UPI003BAA6C8B